MKIGCENNYLEITPKLNGGFTYFHLIAKITENQGTFYGENNRIVYGGGKEGLNNLHKFENYEDSAVHIVLSENSYLKLLRESRGNVSISFQISAIIAGEQTSMKGSVGIDGEHAQTSITKLAKYFYKCL